MPAELINFCCVGKSALSRSAPISNKLNKYHFRGKRELIDSIINVNEATISTASTIKKIREMRGGTDQRNSTHNHDDNLSSPDSVKLMKSNVRSKKFGNSVQPKPTFNGDYLNVRNHWATKYVNQTYTSVENKRQLEESVSNDSKKSRTSNSVLCRIISVSCKCNEAH